MRNGALILAAGAAAVVVIGGLVLASKKGGSSSGPVQLKAGTRYRWTLRGAVPTGQDAHAALSFVSALYKANGATIEHQGNTPDGGYEIVFTMVEPTDRIQAIPTSIVIGNGLSGTLTGGMRA